MELTDRRPMQPDVPNCEAGTLPTGLSNLEAWAAVQCNDWLAAIVPGKEYFWKRTNGWNWFGEERWWEIFVVFANGFNGGGGAYITERWRWNGSSETIVSNPRNLSYAETVELVTTLAAND